MLLVIIKGTGDVSYRPRSKQAFLLEQVVISLVYLPLCMRKALGIQ
jgi:hypothetical protein